MLSVPSRLRAQCLNFWEVLAQAIALISPTMTAALIVPLMYATTGNASWLAYAFGTVMLLFVAFNLNVFARRSSHTGSMFLYTVAGLGRTVGGLSGWCLIWAYVFIGTAGVTGFTIFAQQLLGMAGLHVPAIVLFAVCALASWFFAYRDIALSTILMLVIESVSVLVIMVLAVIALGHTGVVDPDQLTLKGNSISTLGLGVVVAIFSLVGFECATAFGEEAKNPLKTIPRAVIVSLLVTGAFFVFISYVEIMALRTANPSLDKLTTPLSTMATMLHVDILQIPIDAGAMISFFSLALSCMNAGARVVYQMGRQGFFHEASARAHASHQTPHIAVTILALLEFVIPTIMTTAAGLGVSDAFGDAGTFGAFGFLGAYVFVSIAAPMYLRKIGELRPRDTAFAALALVCLLVPAVGSVYPVPAPPVNWFPYIFGVYFVGGLIFFLSRRKSTKSVDLMLPEIPELENVLVAS